MYVRCGYCYNCLKLKARQLASRMYHHHSWLRDNVKDYHPFFITLSYSDVGDNDGKTHYPDVQRLFKSLRYNGLKFDYFVVNEYGCENDRLHYHLILFVHNVSHVPLNTSLPDYYVGKKKRRLCTLPEKSFDAYLRKFWRHGITQTGSAANGSFVYVTKYILKTALNPSLKTFYRQSQCLGYQYYLEHRAEVSMGFSFGPGYPRVPAPRAATHLCVSENDRREAFFAKSLDIFYNKHKNILQQ